MTVTCGAGTHLDEATGMCVSDDPAAWEQWADPGTYQGFDDPLGGLWRGLFGDTPTEQSTPQSPAAAAPAATQTIVVPTGGSAVPDWAIYSGLGLAAVGLLLVAVNR